MSKRKELESELTKLFNYWIKKNEINSDGYLNCFTCKKLCHISGIDAGHFQGSRKKPTRWDMQNVKPQCRECNNTNNGMRDIFAIELDKMYGVGAADRIKTKSNSYMKYTEYELEEMISHYTELINS